MRRSTKPELIVMLTHGDRTVANAPAIFEMCKSSRAGLFGFKNKGIPLSEMKSLFSYMKQCEKRTVLEVVEYTEKECIEGVKIGVECGCDIIMGTVFFDSVNDICQENNIMYMPFVGQVSGIPSVLHGSIESMLQEAEAYLDKGVHGIDLLGYRHAGDPETLIREFVSRVNAPVCVAGSISSYQRVDEVIDAGAWAFTIGGAFFEKRFGETHCEQIDNVCEYVAKRES